MEQVTKTPLNQVATTSSIAHLLCSLSGQLIDGLDFQNKYLCCPPCTQSVYFLCQWKMFSRNHMAFQSTLVYFSITVLSALWLTLLLISFHLLLHLSVGPSTRPSIWPSINLSIHSPHSSIHPYTPNPPTHPLIPSIHPSSDLVIPHPSDQPLVCLSILHVHPSVHPFIHPSIQSSLINLTIHYCLDSNNS